jgi:hypothetical protein
MGHWRVTGGLTDNVGGMSERDGSRHQRALSVQFDPTSADVVMDPYPFLAELRRRAPVLWHDGLGMWLAPRYAEASAVLRDRRLGRVWRPRWPAENLPAFTLIHVHSLLESEPPVHTRLRRLVANAFARGHVERLRPRIAVLAEALADAVADTGADGTPVDLLPAYAEPLPVAVIAELLGIPDTDRTALRPWSNAIVKMYEYAVSPAQRQAAEQASAEFVDYLRDLVAHRRRAPGHDLVSSLVAVSKLADYAAGEGLTFTRYVDDLAFSGEPTDKNFDDIQRILVADRWTVNPNKTAFMRRGGPQYVTGLYVGCSDRPRIPRHIKRQMRWATYVIVKFGYETYMSDFGGGDEVMEPRRLLGWARYIAAVEPDVGYPLLRTLSENLPDSYVPPDQRF